MKRIKIPAAIFSLCITMAALTGCSSTKYGADFKLDTRRITIVTEPAGATVRQLRPMGQGSSYLGKTPLNDQTVLVLTEITKVRNLSLTQYENLMRHVNNAVVRIEKDGYEPYYGTLRVEEDKTVVHEIVLQEKPKDGSESQ